MAKLSFTKSFTRITVNGQTYNSVEEMPPEVRQQYEKAMGMLADKNNNGVPDVLEGSIPPGAATVIKQVSTTQRTIGAGPGLKLPPLNVQTESTLNQSPFDSTESDGGIRLRWPTLIAIILTAVVVTMMVMWGMRR